MITLIHHFNGQVQGAILLSITTDVARVAIPGIDDAVEFRRHREQWRSEEGEIVDLQFRAVEAEVGTPLAPGVLSASN